MLISLGPRLRTNKLVFPWAVHSPCGRLIAVDVPLAGAATADEERTFLATKAGVGITEWSLGWFNEEKERFYYIYLYMILCL